MEVSTKFLKHSTNLICLIIDMVGYRKFIISVDTNVLITSPIATK